MKCACTASLNIANINKIAKESTTVKFAKNKKPARQLKPGQKDARKIQKMSVVLEVTVLTNMI